MITFAEARKLVAKSLPDGHTLTITDWGMENADYYRVMVGPAAMFDEDTPPAETPMDIPAVLVHKETGEITRHSVISILSTLSGMTPVGVIPAHLT